VGAGKMLTKCCTFGCSFTQNAVNSVSQKCDSGNGSLHEDTITLGETVDEVKDNVDEVNADKSRDKQRPQHEDILGEGDV